MADIGKGKVCDVVCDAIQLIRGHLQVGPDSLQQRVDQDEDQDLPHDADGAKPGLVVVGRQADHSANQFQQALKERAANLADEAAQRGGGLGEFVDQDAKVPVGPIAPADAVEARANDRSQDVFGRRELFEGGANAFQLSGLQGLLHDHGVEAQLVAEVIVDRGDVGAGGDADFADGGGAIAPVGKDPPGNVEQLVASRSCEHTSTAKARPRESATLKRFSSNRNSAPRGASSALEGASE